MVEGESIIKSLAIQLRVYSYRVFISIKGWDRYQARDTSGESLAVRV